MVYTVLSDILFEDSILLVLWPWGPFILAHVKLAKGHDTWPPPFLQHYHIKRLAVRWHEMGMGWDDGAATTEALVKSPVEDAVEAE